MYKTNMNYTDYEEIAIALETDNNYSNKLIQSEHPFNFCGLLFYKNGICPKPFCEKSFIYLQGFGDTCTIKKCSSYSKEDCASKYCKLNNNSCESIIPSDISKTVDDFLTKFAGNETFKNNYKFKYSNCTKLSRNSCNVIYTFLKDNNYGVEATINIKYIMNKVSMDPDYEILSCKDDLNNCEFKLKNEQLLNILKSFGINKDTKPELSFDKIDGKLVLKIHDCKETKTSFNVDLLSGRTFNIKDLKCESLNGTLF